MKNVKLYLLLCLLGLTGLPVSAQTKLHMLLDYRHTIGLKESGDYGTFTNYMYGNLLHLTALYSFTSKYSAGIGVGLDRYESPGYNTLPLYATLHYSPCRQLPRAYLYADAGYALKMDNFIPGYLLGAGIGYKKMFKKHFGLNFLCGFNLKQFKGTVYQNSAGVYEQTGRYVDMTQTRSSVDLGIGLIF